ncbi:MAG: multiheme c-type cytochrome, partial [Pirellulaceae bacterium]
MENTGLYQQWGNSKHYQANVRCFECHIAKEGEADAFKHEGEWIATIVSPKDCSRCHAREGEEFAHSHHSKAGRILGSLDNILAEVVEGNRGMITP